MQNRKFEVHGVDNEGNLWIVASDNEDAAKGIAKKSQQDGLHDVQIIKKKN